MDRKRKIENRIQRKLDDMTKICSRHRYELGVCWQQRRVCLHPSHEPLARGKKSCTTDLAPLRVVEKLNKEVPFSFILGGRICRKHLTLSSASANTDSEPQIDVIPCHTTIANLKFNNILAALNEW